MRRLLCLLNHWPWRKCLMIWSDFDTIERQYRCRLCGDRFTTERRVRTEELW